MGRGIGESIREATGPSNVYPKDLLFSGYVREMILRIPRVYIALFGMMALFVLPLGLLLYSVTDSRDIALLLIASGFVVPFVCILVIMPLMIPLMYILFKFQKIFREFNRSYFEGSNLVIDHTERPGSPWIRNIIPIASISLATQAGSDYWDSRTRSGNFRQKLYYPHHLPPEGGLYHAHSDPKNLFIIYLGKPQEIETPYRKANLFHMIHTHKAVVKEIIIDVGKEHQDDFLRALNRKGVKIKRPHSEPGPTFIERQALGGSVRYG